MSRPKAFSDAQFLKALPNTEIQAITAKEFAPLVGCQESTAQKWLREQLNTGIVAMGPATYNGAHTYYRTTTRPDIAMPRIADMRGVYHKIDEAVRLQLTQNLTEARRNPNKLVMIALLETWVGACSDDLKFGEHNQRQRMLLQQHRVKIIEWLRVTDSLLNDPFLAGGQEEISMAQDAIRAASDDIDLQEVIDYCNGLRAL